MTLTLEIRCYRLDLIENHSLGNRINVVNDIVNLRNQFVDIVAIDGGQIHLLQPFEGFVCQTVIDVFAFLDRPDQFATPLSIDRRKLD